MSQAIKVGIFATICLIILAVLIWKIEDINPLHPKGERISAVFDTVAGLDDKASVRVAGVKIGKVDGIGLYGEQAKVSLLLETHLHLTQGTIARISNMGLLGDKYVEIVPGPKNAPPLPPGAILPGETPVSIDQALAKLNKIGDAIQGVTGQLNGGGNGAITKLLDSLQLTSDEIRMLVVENRANVAATMGNFSQFSATLARELPRLAGEMQRTVAQISQLVEENRGDVRGSTANIRELTSRLQTSVDNLNKITGTIASGEGTVGKLVNKDEAYNKVVSTLDSIKGGVDTVSATIGALQRFRFDLDLNGYVLKKKDSQSNFFLDIDPQSGRRLYRAGLSTTPQGSVSTKTQVITTTLPDGSKQTETIERVETDNSRVFTGLFGYRAPNDMRLWAGLIEGSGGVSAEYPWAEKRLQFKIDAFDFNRPNNQRPHLRFTTRWQFNQNLYLLGGYDDPLERSSLFIGGGIRWNDDNIKYLLGAVPKL